MKLDKDSVLQVLQMAMDQMNALPDVGDQSAEIEALKAELEQKKSEVEALNLQVSDLQGKVSADAAALAEVNALAKQIDEKIPD